MPRGNTVALYGYSHRRASSAPPPAFSFSTSAADNPAALLSPQSSMVIGSALIAVLGVSCGACEAGVPPGLLVEVGALLVVPDACAPPSFFVVDEDAVPEALVGASSSGLSPADLLLAEQPWRERTTQASASML